MEIYINNTRTFGDYAANRHHHDLMLANGCMAGAHDDQHKVDIPRKGDAVALYANKIGIVAYGFATDTTAYLDDDRVGGHPTKVRMLADFTLISFPIRSSEYATSNTQTLQRVIEDRERFWQLLQNRATPAPDASLFMNTVS